ncbi:mCG147123 [Mus musculus]|nr:mCG147123 [Mus musculus]
MKIFTLALPSFLLLFFLSQVLPLLCPPSPLSFLAFLHLFLLCCIPPFYCFFQVLLRSFSWQLEV